MNPRTFHLNVKISEVEREMLRFLAERQGVTASDYLRMFILREIRALPKATREVFGE